MDAAYIALIILAVIYVPIWLWVWRKPQQAERYHLVKYGPCIMIKTQLGMRTMDRCAKYTRFWRVFGFCSKVVSAVLFFLMMYMLIVALMAVPGRLASGSSIGIEYALAIPGFNPILPLSYGIVALVIAMVVHELGHGIQSRANGVKVDSSGLLYGVVPLGAFVEPNEEELSKSYRRVQMDMYTAGISVNTVVAVLSIVLMIGACGMVSSDYGDTAGVYSVDSGSPAYIAGIPTSALILEIVDEDGNQISTDTVVYNNVVSFATTELDPTQLYDVTYLLEDGEHTVEDVQLGTFIRSVTVGSPANEAGMKPGEILYTLSLDGGEPVMISSPYQFTEFMADTQSGQTLTITTVSVYDGTGEVEVAGTYTLILTDRNGQGFAGLSVNTSGIGLTTPDIRMDIASDPFYGATDPYSYITSFFGFLSGPFNGMDPISDSLKWWYDVPLGDVFWVLLSLLYWIFWLDILLAISNALPAYPFDGGFIFAGGVSWLLEKLGIRDAERNKRISDSISNSVSTVVLFMFMIVVLSFLL